MSSDVIARVAAFVTKATELADKGHILRAAENYGRAADAARALGADNLITAHLQLRRGDMLCMHAATVPAPTFADHRSLAAHRAECIALFSGTIATLERRCVAGTLLYGKCTAAEVAWRTSTLHPEDGASLSAAAAASLSAHVGHEHFLSAATSALSVLVNAGKFAAECSHAQLCAFAQHVVHAAEIMQQPRRHGGMSMHDEAEFTDALRQAVCESSAIIGLDARLAQLLAGAWQRLQLSGVLQARRIDRHIESLVPNQQAFHSAVKSSLTAPGLRSCALPGCSAREAHPAHFKSCAACRAVVYCCREHQVAGWPSHKKACKAARKAAAAEGGAGPSGA